MVIFYDVTRRLLDQRADTVRQGQLPQYTDMRHLFYEARLVFLRENLQFTKIDSKSKTPYTDWQTGAVNLWCLHHCAEFNVDPELYWRVREKLNIWAEGRAVCEGESGKFVIDHETRARVAQDCSFILLCEKKTVSKELLEGLKALGYKVNLVSTGGYSASDVQEAIMQISEELDGDNPTFYIIVLHDFDRDGVKIFFNLKERYANVIDAGVNGELINYLKSQGNFDSRLVEEQTLNRNMQSELREKIAENDSAYALADFDYLQGVQQPDGKTWIGKRIEIDAIHVQYGIGPFIRYILKKMDEECNNWDLRRIGVEEFSLDEPENPFQVALDYFHQTVSEKCNAALSRIFEPLNSVRELVIDVTSEFTVEYGRLLLAQGIVNTKQAYEDGTWVYHVNRTDIETLKLKYKEGFEREYADDYEDDRNELNARVQNFEGDVTTAVATVHKEHEELQTDVNDAAEGDEEAWEFEDELGKVGWNKEEFDKLTVPDEKQVVRAVIEKLTEQLKKLEAGEAQQ